MSVLNLNQSLSASIWKNGIRYYFTKKVYKGRIDQLDRKSRMMDKLHEIGKYANQNEIVIAKNNPLLSTRARGDPRPLTRRQLMLNKNFMSVISDALLSESINKVIGKYGVRLTQIQISKHYDYLNVYWNCNDDHDIDVVGEDLSRITGALHEIVAEQHFMGRIPQIQFNHDLSCNRAAFVRKLIQKADYGPGFVPSDPTIFTPPTKVISNEEKSIEDLKFKRRGFSLYKRSLVLFDEYRTESDPSKTNNENKTPVFEHPEDMNLNVLGLDYRSIMDKVLFHMKKTRAEHRGYNAVADPLPPAEWVAPAPFPATDDETEPSLSPDERINIMKKFMVDNRKKRHRMSRDARRELDERLMILAEHVDGARERLNSEYDAQYDHSNDSG